MSCSALSTVSCWFFTDMLNNVQVNFYVFNLTRSSSIQYSQRLSVQRQCEMIRKIKNPLEVVKSGARRAVQSVQSQPDLDLSVSRV